MGDPDTYNKPKEGYEYFYFDYNAEAVYENGSWKLTEIRHDGFMV